MKKIETEKALKQFEIWQCWNWNSSG